MKAPITFVLEGHWFSRGSHVVATDTRVHRRAVKYFRKRNWLYGIDEADMAYFIIICTIFGGDPVVKHFLAYCWMFAEKLSDQK